MQRYFSNIYWHFTGSPIGIDWSKIRKPADILSHGKPKSDRDATDILIKILDSRRLLASSSEVITDKVKTDPFCCVTDIPLKDLNTHSAYYGKVAIGLNAKAVQKSFFPVLYFPQSNLPVAQHLIEPDEYCQAECLAAYEAGDTAQAMHWDEMSIQYGKYEKYPDHTRINNFFKDFIKITDFSVNPNETFYREREWRHLGDFEFAPDNIEAIVAPKDHIHMIKDYLANNNYYKDALGISIVSWEFVDDA